MTTGSSLQNRQLPRQPAAPRALRAQAATAAAGTTPPPTMMNGAAQVDDEFRMNLTDLPRVPLGLHVDGFAPSLTSRVLDLFERLRRR